ncbi:MAG TPA: recombinase family protein, partial [Gemmataceae bacterium]|nr:recombinase family protein [Gemmataceae bacterium]
LTFRDLGVSAWRGRNAAVGNFRTFLDAVKTGRVAPGSALIVESIDRISRQGIDEGYDLIKSILKADVKIVTLVPEREFDRDATRSLTKGALEIQLILERAAEESGAKSKRCADAWANKRAGAAGRVVTRKRPGWVRAVGGEGKRMKETAPGEVRFELIQQRAVVVRQVFQMAIDGMGVSLIAKRLNDEKVPVIGRKVFKGRPVIWTQANVYHLLTSRSAFGEFQPRKGRGSKNDRALVSEPIADYFPAAIDRETFDAAQHAMRVRSKCGRGRRGKRVYLFSGLLRDAHNGGSMYYKEHDKARGTSIIPVDAKNGRGGPWSCFPAAPFDDAVISQLREVKVSDIEGESAGAVRVAALSGELAEVESLAAKWRQKMDNLAIVDTVAAKLEELNGRIAELRKDLAEAEREAGSTLAEAWGEFGTLAELLSQDTSDALREKVRSALRRAVESVTCLFLGRGRIRLAAVRVQFRTGRHRDYVIAYKPGYSNRTTKRPGRMEVRSFAEAGLPDKLDLRKPADVKHVEAMLGRLELKTS